MELIQKERQRKRLDSIPIVNGIGSENPKDREMNLLEVEQPKERKRFRKDDEDSETERMEIIKDVTDEHMCVVETRVISGLIENVEEEEVRSLIECFNPIIRSSPDHIKQTMLECSDKWENKKNVYIGAINYIAHGRQEERGIDEQLKERSLGALCEILTREIENRMPKQCGNCEQCYIVKLKDQPVIHCMWCKVGMHDCTQNKGIKNCKGIKWLCKTCEPVFTKHFLPKLDKAAFFEGFEKVKNPIVPQEVIKQPEEQQTDKQEMDKIEEPVIIIQVEDESTVEVNDSTVEGSERSKESNENKERNDKPETPKEICWFLKNKKCRFGTNCKYEHPEQCKEILETGRCYDQNKCKLFHPKICRNLFYKGYCPRGESCWFTHPSKCQNNQPKYMMENSYANNQSLYNNRQIQNMNSQNRSPNFLGAWPTPANVSNQQSYGTSQNPSMMLMMQNMMEKLTQMDSKIFHMERGRQMHY